MSRVAALINPTAGKGRARAVWERLRQAEPQLAEALVIEVPDAGQARAVLAETLERGIDRLLVFGGDGSIHLAVNVLLERGYGGAVALGAIPGGTGSDFGRHLGLPRDPLACVRRVLAAVPRPVDAIEILADDGRRSFAVNVGSAGISGLVDEAVNALHSPGPLAYFRATVSALRRYRPLACAVRVDGKPWFEGRMLVLAVANGSTFGRGMRIAPRARSDDGMLDVVLVEAVPTWELLLRLPQLYLGRHLENRHVWWGRGVSVRIEPLEAFPPFDVDGEVVPSFAATFAVLPGALRMLV